MFDAERVVKLYSEALSSEAEKSQSSQLSLEDRQALSQRLVDFADRHCSPSETAAYEERHASDFSSYKVESASRKRAAAGSVDEPAAKKAALNGSPGDGMLNSLPQATPAAFPQMPSSAPAGEDEPHKIIHTSHMRSLHVFRIDVAGKQEIQL